MKKIVILFKRYKGPILVLILAIVVIPLIFENCILGYNPNSNVTADGWAGFWGGYLGAIVGAVATIAAVIMEMRNNKKEAKADEEKRIRPYLHLEIEIKKSSDEGLFVEIKIFNVGNHTACNVSLFEVVQESDRKVLWRCKGIIIDKGYMAGYFTINKFIPDFYLFSFNDINGNQYEQRARIEIIGTGQTYRTVSMEPQKL